MDDSLRKGCRVRLFGLSSSLLNGAEGCIVGPFDAEAGRHPVKLLKPTEAVAAYPNGIKVKPINLEKVVLVPAANTALGTGTSQAVRQRTAAIQPDRRQRDAVASTVRSAGSDDQGLPEGPPLNLEAWADGLSQQERAEWLVDCYRMRIDDDYAWGGGQLHGLYNPNHTKDSIVADFLIFCKLAVKNGVVPRSGWSWDQCLAKAKELLPYAFEKSDAKEKYGGENVFSGALGGRSLRFTGEMVYGTSIMQGGRGEAYRNVAKQVKAARLGQLLETQPELFGDVGGVLPWNNLRSRLALVS